MPSDNQPVASKISLVVSPAPKAVEHDAPLTECALNIEMSIPASATYMKVLSHLVIVLLDTGVCCPTYGRGKKKLT